MKITATSKAGAFLELSALNRLEDKDGLEGQPFKITLRAGEFVNVEDKWYDLIAIQNALIGEYIIISDFYKQDPHDVEVSNVSSSTPNFNLTKVEILNRSEYPQDQFEQYNANMDIIDANMGNAAGSTSFIDLTDTPIAYTGQGSKVVKVNIAEDALEFSNASSDAVWGGITGDIEDQTDLYEEFLTQSNAASTYVEEAPNDGSQYARQSNAWSLVGSSSNAVWGTITGVISNQTDLQAELDAKADITVVESGIEYSKRYAFMISGG